MNKIEFNELVREFGEEIYSFEKFLKDCYITEVSYITLFNSFLKEINILTLENQLIKDSLEKLASGIEIEEVRKFVIEQKQQLTRTIASLVERDNYYKRVYDNTSPYFPNGNKELEDLYHDYCINHHPAVRAIITKPEEEIYNNLKRLYSENEYDAFVKYLEEKKSLFDNREIPQDKYNDVSLHYYRLRKNMVGQRNNMMNQLPYKKKEVFKDEMSIASEEAELRIQIKKLKELNDALHKDLEKNTDLIIKL